MCLLWKGGTSGRALYVCHVRLKSSALLIGLPFGSLEDNRINCKLYNKAMSKRRTLGCWVRADKIDRYYRTTDRRCRETLELLPSDYSST